MKFPVCAAAASLLFAVGRLFVYLDTKPRVMKKLQFLPLLMLVFLAACEEEQPMPTHAAEASAIEFRGEKVTICHVKGNGDRIVLNVSASAVEAHLAHGDELGDCSITPDVGEEYAGGLVFYVVPEGEEMDLNGDGSPDQGLVAAPVSTEAFNLLIPDDLWYAEGLEAGGYDDWFMPTIDQLELMWANLGSTDLNGNGYNDGPDDNAGGFASDFYGHTTYDATVPCGRRALNFRDGTRGDGSSNGCATYTRAVRAF